jgi:lipopolysaccharide export system protein LptA
MLAYTARLVLSRRGWWLVLALAGAAAPGAWAEKADKLKPLTFTADALRYDDTTQTNVLTGNVIINKGTMTLKAGRVEVRQAPDGQQTAVATAAPGKLAFFRQKRDGVDEFIEGEADRVEYDSKSDTVRLIGNAVIRRLRGTVMVDEVQGQTITYDNLSEVFTVAGGSGESGRVRGVLTPRDAPPAGEKR